ncbi:hypothetical protein ACWD6N_28395 [Micromonospora sp. NPDC005163]
MDRALDALAAFTITDRETATVLLDTWSGRHQLNPTDRATVLDHYPSSNGSRPRAC